MENQPVQPRCGNGCAIKAFATLVVMNTARKLSPEQLEYLQKLLESMSKD